VNAEKPYKNAKDYITAAKAANGTFKMGGTGSKQEDQIITEALQKATGAKFIYIPQSGGGAVAVQLVGNHIDSSVNNPTEAISHWRGGKLRPLCVFDNEKLKYDDKITGDLAWSSVPTCKSAGLDIEYLMLRGVFMTPDATKDQVDYYVELFKKVRATDEWKKMMADGAFNQTFMTGKQFTDWVAKEEKVHQDLMKAAGFLAAK
jgi:putative tricarboxylic transport membrane protein